MNDYLLRGQPDLRSPALQTLLRRGNGATQSRGQPHTWRADCVDLMTVQEAWPKQRITRETETMDVNPGWRVEAGGGGDCSF